MRISLSIFILLLYLNANAQVDSMHAAVINEVIITSIKEESMKESTLSIERIKIDSVSKQGTYNLTESLTKTPGVSMLSTGVAIAKPVIRGLYGNRILVLLSGLKFDNQQWQEEHGLGLSDLGLDRVELIKGPLSVLYGSEAIGGVINIIEESKPALGKKEFDFGIKFHSNTLGGLIQFGKKVNKGSHWYRIRVGIENNGDYSDGNNHRVLNSRFDGYYVKATYGFNKKNWTSTIEFASSFNRFGFLFNDALNFIETDARWSRSFKNPAHFVVLNMLSNENKFLLKNNRKLSINYGFQSNVRMENEGGGNISLNMHLMTFQYLAKYETKLNDHNQVIISSLGSIEDNTNYGARKIIPDARMQEENLSIYLESKINSTFSLENGLGIGEKFIRTYFTPSVNSPDKLIYPFTKLSSYYNAYSGFNYTPTQSISFKFNLATGVRIPNLAELSSNGLHEGIFTYEIGDPKLKNEQNVNANLHAAFTKNKLDCWVASFYNYFYNYVYLAPTAEQWFGFPILRIRQQNARQYGLEAGFDYAMLQNLRLGINYSSMRSKTEEGAYIAYTPAQKLAPSIMYSLKFKKQVYKLYSNADIYSAQNHVAPHEKTTPSYALWNIGASSIFNLKSKKIDVALAVNNLLNTAYYDHLSRLKNYGLLNIGRNISLMCNWKF